MPIESFGPIFTLMGTSGGIWAVVVMFRRFQKDFNDQYRQELADERQRRKAAEQALDHERDMRLSAELEVSRRGQILAAHDIPFPAVPE